VKDGETVYQVTIPANGKRAVAWQVQQANTDE